MRFVVFREPRSGVRAPDAGGSAGRGRAACGGRRPRSGLRPSSGPRGPMRRSRPPVVRAFVLARGARRRSLAALRFRPRFNIDLFQNRLSSTPQPRKFTGLLALRGEGFCRLWDGSEPKDCRGKRRSAGTASNRECRVRSGDAARRPHPQNPRNPSRRGL